MIIKEFVQKPNGDVPEIIVQLEDGTTQKYLKAEEPKKEEPKKVEKEVEVVVFAEKPKKAKK